MPSIIILDTGPLSSCVIPPVISQEPLSESQRCRRWLQDCEQAGAILLVPAITYYEVLRELERRQAIRKIERLRAFAFSSLDRFIPLTTAHLEKAAQLWGASRNLGKPTASRDALDGDVILAAQSLSLGLSENEFVIATTNVGHLSQFVPTTIWHDVHVV